ncbi:MAG: cell division protein ZapA [Nitrospina sp.]|nr:MAG: cell division protein ZapA [Nitrospina sp.]TDJ58445.1 MAG: cell division protein ZapA [Nitrospina sp.]
MSEKNQITVYGKTYKIKTDLASVNAQDLADYVNDKMHELSSGKTKPSTIDLAILTALNIAGELFEVQGTAKQEMTQKKLDQKEADQKVRHLVQMVEKELGRMQASRGAAR